MSTPSIATTNDQLSIDDLQLKTQNDHVKLVNSSRKRIVFHVKTAKKQATTTPTGILEPNEAAILRIKFSGTETDDRLTIIWTNPPEGSDKQYRSDYFSEEALVRHKNLPTRFPTIQAILVTFEK